MLKNLFSPRLLKKVQMSLDVARDPEPVEGPVERPDGVTILRTGTPQMGLFQQSVGALSPGRRP